MTDVDWFGKGWAVYKGALRDGAFFPPLNDIEAQRWWLGGFGAAWAADVQAGEPVDEALVCACAGREELLRQLRSHRDGWGSRTVQ